MEITADEAETRLAELADLLVDAVDGGASNGFLRPLELKVATGYWAGRIDDLAAGRSVLLGVLGPDDDLVGIVVVDLAGQPNGQHRAEITKLIVRSDVRRQGLGSHLLAQAEQTALARGRWLLVLDTVPGSDADRLYRRHGWSEVGLVPDFALLPDGQPAPTMIFYKRLA